MSALESSVTLDDVFIVVGAKRVPLAPELAGYLALEIAEGAGATVGDVDPKAVYIGEEGSVALVVRRREGATQAAAGDAETSIRVILARLLDASGSQTVALGGVAKRRTGVGLGGLVEELEAALIPVNRAAGRRALARLAREVKRVTLGVGRNATLAPNEPAPARRASSPSNAAVRDRDEARPPTRAGLGVPEESSHARGAAPSAPSAPDAHELPTIELRRDKETGTLGMRAPPASPVPHVPPAPSPARSPSGPPASADEVDHLLASFGVSHSGEKAAARELKALVGLEPTPPPPTSLNQARPESAPPEGPRSGDADLDSLLAFSDSAPPPVAAKAAALAHSARALESPPTSISPALANEPYGSGSRGLAAASPSGTQAPTLASASTPLPATPPPAAVAPPRASLPSEPSQPSEPMRGAPTGPSMRRVADVREYREPRAPKTGRALMLFALVVLLAGVAAVYALNPGFMAGHAPQPAPPSPSGGASTQSTSAQAPKCHESLIVTDAPANAEILLRVGQAPVDVDRMPVGPRLEFVATAEGFAPKRAVVPAGTPWDPGTDGRPRYEVAVQLDKTRARPGAVDGWPAGEPGSDVGGKGSPGVVHLVTTPRGAEVWMLAGLGPEAHIAELPVSCTADVDVLVAGPSTLRKRLHVAQSEFVSDGGTDRQARVSAR